MSGEPMDGAEPIVFFAVSTRRGARTGVGGAGARTWSRSVWRRPKCRRVLLNATASQVPPSPPLPPPLPLPPPPEPASQAYEVVFSRVVVRAAPSTAAAVVGSKSRGELVAAEEVVDGWIRVAEPSLAGFMLIDGATLGLGQLLRPLSGASAPARSPRPPPAHALRLCDGGAAIELRGGVRMPLLGLGTGGVPGCVSGLLGWPLGFGYFVDMLYMSTTAPLQE